MCYREVKLVPAENSPPWIETMTPIEVIDTAIKIGLGALIGGIIAFLLERQKHKSELTKEKRAEFQSRIVIPIIAFIDGKRKEGRWFPMLTNFCQINRELPNNQLSKLGRYVYKIINSCNNKVIDH